MRTSIVGAANVVVDFANFIGGSYFLNGSRPPFFAATDGFAVLSWVWATTVAPIVRAIVAIKLNRIVRSYFISFFLIMIYVIYLPWAGGAGCVPAGGGGVACF